MKIIYGIFVIIVIYGIVNAPFQSGQLSDVRWKVPPLKQFNWDPREAPSITWYVNPEVESASGTQTVSLLYSKENTTVQHIVISADIVMNSELVQDLLVVGDIFKQRLQVSYHRGNLTCTFKNLNVSDTGQLRIYIDYDFPLTAKTRLQVTETVLPVTEPPTEPVTSQSRWYIPVVCILSVACAVLLIVIVIRKRTVRSQSHNDHTKNDTETPLRDEQSD